MLEGGISFFLLSFWENRMFPINLETETKHVAQQICPINAFSLNFCLTSIPLLNKLWQRARSLILQKQLDENSLSSLPTPLHMHTMYYLSIITVHTICSFKNVHHFSNWNHYSFVFTCFTRNILVLSCLLINILNKQHLLLLGVYS